MNQRVIAILGLLMFLAFGGFIYFLGQERSDDEYYAEAAEVWAHERDPETFTQEEMELLILGARTGPMPVLLNSFHKETWKSDSTGEEAPNDDEQLTTDN